MGDAVFAEYMASLNEGRSYRTTALDTRKDGTPFPVEVNGTVFTYRGRPHVLGVVRDITELAHARELLERRAKEALYRIAQEALQNALKHARPTRAEVRLECIDGDLLLEIRDDGAGFETTGTFPGHLGLRSMRERATQFGGTLELESAPGSGTCVRARIPFHGGD
jgi:two-component sensor histidine kinase